MIVHVVSHPEVLADPTVPVPQWGPAPAGYEQLQRSLVVPWVRSASFVASRAEREALQTAQAVAEVSRCAVHVEEELGENDRSATGFVPPQQFEALVDAFFAEPEDSVCGGETAADAQRRICRGSGPGPQGCAARRRSGGRSCGDRHPWRCATSSTDGVGCEERLLRAGSCPSSLGVRDHLARSRPPETLATASTGTSTALRQIR
ncbi:histidine phosphatase family protein [Kineococcus aurantiacus]|uniref:Uncharacterized protein n=1 Tax=Kineococcus aurantiacus TaxID=37633 RepID=A0A7Y9DQ19_9ACTN|nr:histidine phosphatase family protein [Kineococcus aurantiacus]NYD24716.1 hypothetical protein [Kineococcus aurantiacus]